MKLLLLLLVIGLCSGLQYPLQYRYQYGARVSAAIPEINKHHAAVSEIRAELDVFVTSPSTVIFKLADVEVGEFHGIMPCEADLKPLNLSYMSTQNLDQENPIGKHGFAIENGVYIFNEEEPQWLVNFYKSILSLFNIAPVKETFFHSARNYSQSGAYEKTEDTVMGECRTTYTQHKLAGVSAAQLADVPEDCQLGAPADPITGPGHKTPGGRKVPRGRKTPRHGTKRPGTSKTNTVPRPYCPEISSSSWEVVRSVDLEDCQDRVEFQMRSNNIYCDLSEDQCKNLLSRNSHGVYKIRGDENGMRLEQAEIKGAIIVSPFGYTTEHLQTITRQSLYLSEVKPLDARTVPDIHQSPTKSVEHLLSEMVTPNINEEDANLYKWAKPGTNAQAAEGLIFTTVTEEMRDESEARVIQMFRIATHLLSSGAKDMGSKLPNILNFLSFHLMDFTREQIARVITALESDHSGVNLLWDVLATSGSKPAVTSLVDAMKNGKISPFRQVMVISSLSRNFFYSEALKPLLDFLMNEDMDVSPFKTSQSIVNFASLVRSVCLSKTSDTLSVISRRQCERDHIVGNLEEHIIVELEQATKFWKQMVLVQSLVNLKTVTATNALLPYILGAKECDTMVRSVAMDSLARWNAASGMFQSKITLILLDILENPTEHRLLRGRALGYLVSWPLSSTAWTRLAFLTKRPGIKDLSALTYSIIKSTAEYSHPEMIRQKQFASHALQLARPSSAASRYSSFCTWYKYYFADQIGGVDHVAIIKDPTSPLPSELALYVRRSLGGAVFFTKADFMISNDHGDIDIMVIKLFLDKLMGDTHRDRSKSGRWTSFINMLKSDLNIVAKYRDTIRGLVNHISLHGVQFFLPLEHEMILSTMQAISDRAPYLGIETAMDGLYLNTNRNFLISFNDIGLPVVATVANPTFLQLGGTMNFMESGNERYDLYSSGMSFVYFNNKIAVIDSYVPWSKTCVTSAVANLRTLRLPYTPQIQLAFPFLDRDGFLVVKLDTTTTTPTLEIPLLEVTNYPFTVLRDALMPGIEDIFKTVKLVSVADDGQPKEMVIFPLPMGHEFVYRGDVRNPFGVQNLMGMLFGDGPNINKFILSPTMKFFYLRIATGTTYQPLSFVLNITLDHLERLSSAGRLVSLYGQDSFQEYELCGKDKGETQQTGQQNSEDYWDQSPSQFSQSPANEFESFGSFGSQQAQEPERLVMHESTDAETVRPFQGLGDVTEPQLTNFLQYLQREAGWASRVDGTSIRLEVHSDSGIQAIEAVLAKTVCYSLQDRFRSQFVFVIARSSDDCYTTCAEGVVEGPKLNDLDTLSSILGKNLSKHTDVNFYSGAKCNDGPFLTLKDERSLGAETRDAIEADLKSREACNLEPEEGVNLEPLDLVEEFHKVAQYDEVKIAVNYTDASNLRCNTIHVAGMIEALYRKYIFKMSCNTDGGPETYLLEAHRHTDDSWEVMKTYANGGITFENKRFPAWLEHINSLTVSSDYTPAEYCIIAPAGSHLPDSIAYLTTFDKRFEKIELENCPVLVATPCEIGQYDTFALAVKRSRDNSLAMNIAAQYKRLIINIDSDGVEVNGEPMEANVYVKTLHYENEYGYQQEAGHVYRRNGFFKVEIKDTFEILYKEGTFYIKLADRYRGYSCGLCGNYDREPSNDLTGPNGCLMTNAQEFVKAWTPSTSFDCIAGDQTSTDSCTKEIPLPHDYYQQYQL